MLTIIVRKLFGRLYYSKKKILGMHLCKVSVKNRGLTGIFNADTLLDLKQKSKVIFYADPIPNNSK